ncbi:site-specific integrase [Deinococcus detaillensis]|uniref:Site-specific integrase n=1 Tax=Deinococcus detaillensis TaxID=2592048 RepID=A0A553V4U9_9DEIO|nr:site-specific integrase [Deinococcus detaillensis]TSA87497.1 site-specific integrase [Deinococcus detaillensis]
MSESELRQLLIKQDVEGVLNAVESSLPGQPGNATRRNNVSGCRIFLRWAFDSGQSVLSPAETLGAAYLAFLKRKHPDTPASVINRLAHARNLYTALRDQGAVAADPFTQLDAPSNDPALHKEAYTEAEIQRLLTHGNAREQALVLLGAHAGLTGPEVAKLNWRDMQFEQGVLSVRGREVPTGTALHAALQHYAHSQGVTQLFGGEGKVFPELDNDHMVRAALFRVCLSGNVPYRAWRALRNHAGLRMLNLTHDEQRVAQYLGLSTLKAVKFIQRAVDRGMGQESDDTPHKMSKP